MRHSAVIDSSSLINLSYLGKGVTFFYLLENLFHTIHIPIEVKNEYAKGVSFERHRQWVLQKINPIQGLYRLCSSYDSIVLQTIVSFKGIDKGEAEVYAQFRKINAHLIISDDKLFITAIKGLDKKVRIYSSLHIICWLELQKLLPNWEQTVISIYRVNRFKSKDLRSAYLAIANDLGVAADKKMLSKKCSLKPILQKFS